MFFDKKFAFPHQRKLFAKLPFALDFNSLDDSTGFCVVNGKVCGQSVFEILSQSNAESFIFATDTGFVFVDADHTYKANCYSGDTYVNVSRIYDEVVDRGIDFRGTRYYCLSDAVIDQNGETVCNGAFLDMVSCRDRIVGVDYDNKLFISGNNGDLENVAYISAPTKIDRLAVLDEQVYAFGKGIYRLDIRSPLSDSKFVCIKRDIAVATNTVVVGESQIYFFCRDVLYKLQSNKVTRCGRIPLDFEKFGFTFVYYEGCIVFTYAPTPNDSYVLFVEPEKCLLQCVIKQDVTELLTSCGRLYGITESKLCYLRRDSGSGYIRLYCDFDTVAKKTFNRLAIKTAYPVTVEVSADDVNVTCNVAGSSCVQYVNLALSGVALEAVISANGKVAVDELSLFAKCNEGVR